MAWSSENVSNHCIDMAIVFKPDKQQDAFPSISDTEPSKIATLEKKLKEAEDELKSIKAADSRVTIP